MQVHQPLVAFVGIVIIVALLIAIEQVSGPPAGSTTTTNAIINDTQPATVYPTLNQTAFNFPTNPSRSSTRAEGPITGASNHASTAPGSAIPTPDPLITPANSTRSIPRIKLPAPAGHSIMAKLEGLSPCYGKCFISEMHYDTFNPMTEKVGRWCHLSDYWFEYHLIPCLDANCKVDMFERVAGEKWLGQHCDMKNGPGG